MPLISVIIPAYNIEDYIGACLDSLIQQTYKNIEIIVVNDGSSDNTGKVINEYAFEYENMKVIHKKNNGVSAARNSGIDIANGEYIGFIDGDDTIDKDMFEILIDNAIKYDADISHCGYRMVFPSRVDYYHNTGVLINQDNKSGLRDLLVGDKVEPGLWNKIYRRGLFENIRINEDIKINEDLLVNYYLFKKSSKSIFYDKCLYNYTLRKNSASTSKINRNKIMDPIKVAKEILNDLEKDSDLYNLAYERYIMSLIGICRNMQIRNSKEFKNHFDEAKVTLRNEYNNIMNNHYIAKKTKFMVIGNLYLSKMFYIIDDIYAIVTGNRAKYEVK
ncbi:glycosyltransferase family 2 protein [Terrisporobacter glycolicus]|uniref:glycosyltransferase family 2 protein n=1 Tax=Terrisporobacter glycolicus TaxID=36841 RepID=UPI003463AD39